MNRGSFIKGSIRMLIYPILMTIAGRRYPYRIPGIIWMHEMMNPATIEAQVGTDVTYLWAMKPKENKYMSFLKVLIKLQNYGSMVILPENISADIPALHL